jgi:hypothetical protein
VPPVPPLIPLVPVAPAPAVALLPPVPLWPPVPTVALAFPAPPPAPPAPAAFAHFGSGGWVRHCGQRASRGVLRHCAQSLSGGSWVHSTAGTQRAMLKVAMAIAISARLVYGIARFSALSCSPWCISFPGVDRYGAEFCLLAQTRHAATTYPCRDRSYIRGQIGSHACKVYKQCKCHLRQRNSKSRTEIYAVWVGQF